ncbi:thiamine pyrophosphokinase [Colletotrichum higginsianum]|uniref:Thiamine pyrophosphokinase n=1 Tax=Colletotrichum higginsianum (strain IMI 349063) TaxID=759273 RepID=H1VWF3_COLHI|nr:Thiamine pyrophosphokinase [Colletotrichum higginsianum IMI 349063]OBR11164.1 Thiamine pyrophosphokinase [Colletotrichum higginsianum IMI 349063]CCF44565.1 thiamine pyrophosphokinase [Colletotrichum higginsianum]
MPFTVPKDQCNRTFTTLLALVQDSNKFLRENLTNGEYWTFCIHVGKQWKTFGIVTTKNALHLNAAGVAPRWFTLNYTTQQIQLNPEHSANSTRLEAAFDQIRNHLHRAGPWAGKLKKYDDEKWPLVGAPFEAGILCDIVPIFGTVTTGVHLNIFQEKGKETLIYVAQRAKNKSFGSLLDQCAAGGFQSGTDKDALSCMVREAKEELKKGLPENLQGRIKKQQCIQYCDIRDERWGDDEIGVPEPGIKVPFDLELREDTAMRGETKEIMRIEAMNVAQVRAALLAGKFKPNCALVMIDFLIRKNLLTDAQDLRDVPEIRKLLKLTKIHCLGVKEVK